MLNPFKNFETRTLLAFLITAFAIVGTSTLSVAIIVNGKPEEVEKRASLVLNATLPLFGTWVGTVLAYYFARENFQAASESTQRFAELNLQANNNSNDLQFILVETAMVPKIKMFFVSDVSTKISETVKNLDDKNQRRLPILFSDGKINKLVYYEDISKYVNSETARENPQTPPDLNPQTPPNLNSIKNLTLENYLNESKNTFRIFATVNPKASLSYAKEAMKLISPDCRDVFVTEDGKDTSAVIGYLTNIDFDKFSKSR